jgi:hypothetical protein
MILQARCRPQYIVNVPALARSSANGSQSPDMDAIRQSLQQKASARYYSTDRGPEGLQAF